MSQFPTSEFITPGSSRSLLPNVKCFLCQYPDMVLALSVTSHDVPAIATSFQNRLRSYLSNESSFQYSSILELDFEPLANIGGVTQNRCCWLNIFAMSFELIADWLTLHV